VNAPEPASIGSISESAYARVFASSWFAPALLILAVSWEIGTLFLQASRKLFWYDELVTFHVSGLQPFSLLWRALDAGADGMPPGYYLIVRLARLFPGDPLVTLRLPSILGYVLTLFGVYWFARKKLPAFAGLTAVFLITLSPFRAYALEARPYALLVGFLAISAVLWQRAGEKRWMTPLLAVFLALAVSCHHLAVVAIGAFGLAELTWTHQSRRIRWGVWSAFVFAACPFFLDLPLLVHFREIFGKTFWSRPSWSTVYLTYANYLGLGSGLALVVVVFFVIVAASSLPGMLRGTQQGARERGFSPAEIVLAGGLLLYPAVLFVLTKALGSGYVFRYGWPAILGLALGSVYLIDAIWFSRFSGQLVAALLIALVVQEIQDFRLLPPAAPAGVDERWARLGELSRGEPGLPVVIGSELTYLEAVEYSGPDLRGRLVALCDPALAVRLIGTDTLERENRILAQFVPLRLEGLAPFQVAHQTFILYSGGRSDWLTDYLLENGYRLTVLAKDATSSVYLANANQGSDPASRAR
jgi:hypothetical protein